MTSPHPRSPRTVTGPTDHIVVIGAGLAGLAAAMHLAAAGRRVTVVEAEAGPGGRAGLITRTTPDGTYRFDTGPTVLTMPELIADGFEALGEEMADWITLTRVDPAYRARFADGSALAVHSDPEQMAHEIEQFSGPRDAAGYRRYVARITAMYHLEIDHFINRNFDSPLQALTPQLARLP